MKRTLPLLFGLLAAMTWLLFLPNTDGSRLSWGETDVSKPEFFSEPACGINLNLRKRSREKWELQLEESHVRIEFGRWVSLFYDIGGKPLCNKRKLLFPDNSCACRFKLDCSIPRQYRFVLKNPVSGEKKLLFFPSDSTFTTSSRIELGL